MILSTKQLVLARCLFELVLLPVPLSVDPLPVHWLARILGSQAVGGPSTDRHHAARRYISPSSLHPEHQRLLALQEDDGSRGARLVLPEHVRLGRGREGRRAEGGGGG